MNTSICVFCEEGGPNLHGYATDPADANLKLMATEMQDIAMLAKILCGDLVANESKYHLQCLTRYCNRHRAFHGQRDRTSALNRDESINIKMIKARAFAELTSYMETAAEEGTNIFKLARHV